MTPDNAGISQLRAVPSTADTGPRKLFCGHCGEEPTNTNLSEAPASRVCEHCHLGLMLSAPVDAAPNTADPFMVIDGALTICALSVHAEELLGVSETDAINRHITEFLVPADAEAPATENLAALLSWAARGDAPASSVIVRPTNTFGVRYWARVGPCGPPSAALLVLADARP